MFYAIVDWVEWRNKRIICWGWFSFLHVTSNTKHRYELFCTAFTFHVHYVRMSNLFNCVFLLKSLSRAQSQNFLRSFAVILLCSIQSYLRSVLFSLCFSLLFTAEIHFNRDVLFFQFLFWFVCQCVHVSFCCFFSSSFRLRCKVLNDYPAHTVPLVWDWPTR